MNETCLREEMCAVGRRLWERDLVGAGEGNLSLRLTPGRILCTPSGLDKGHMKPEDLLIIDLEGRPVDSTNGLVPSSEIKLHLRILKRRPDCMAVVHAHPPIATGFSVAGESLPDDLLPESIFTLGPVARVPFGMPGTDEVPDGIDPVVADHKTFLLSNHGAATMGKDLWDACSRMETLERVAKIVLVARILGRTEPLPASAMAVLSARLTGAL